MGCACCGRFAAFLQPALSGNTVVADDTNSLYWTARATEHRSLREGVGTLFGLEHALEMCAIVVVVIGQRHSTLCLTQLKGSLTVPGIGSTTGLQLSPGQPDEIGPIEFALGSHDLLVLSVPMRCKTGHRHQQHQASQPKLERPIRHRLAPVRLMLLSWCSG
jgi:hypothetical protein